MADASCSGGTPFKRLTEHQSRDVSHHQDRLVDRSASQAHGSFRSAPQPAHAQDGFNAFMDGPSTLAGMPDHLAAGRLAVHAAALDPAQAYAPAFARSPAPQFQAPQGPAMNPGNWAADFSRFNQQQHHQSRVPQAAPQMPMANPQMGFRTAFQPNFGFSPLYGPTNGGLMDPNAASAQRPAAEAEFDEEMSRWMASHGGNTTGGMEDVDAVMDQMARELELNEAALKEGEAADQDGISLREAIAKQMKVEEKINPEAKNLGPKAPGSLTPSLANLSLETPNTESLQEQQSVKPPRSEVSEAAERLLESVQHETGDKWQQSVFLSLMRDFRDGKKDIVENEIRQASAPGEAKEQVQ